MLARHVYTDFCLFADNVGDRWPEDALKCAFVDRLAKRFGTQHFSDRTGPYQSPNMGRQHARAASVHRLSVSAGLAGREAQDNMRPHRLSVDAVVP
jgi:hypothetical protein